MGCGKKGYLNIWGYQWTYIHFHTFEVLLSVLSLERRVLYSSLYCGQYFITI